MISSELFSNLLIFFSVGYLFASPFLLDEHFIHCLVFLTSAKHFNQRFSEFVFDNFIR